MENNNPSQEYRTDGRNYLSKRRISLILQMITTAQTIALIAIHRQQLFVMSSSFLCMYIHVAKEQGTENSIYIEKIFNLYITKNVLAR